jgi:hypothetical protein
LPTAKSEADTRKRCSVQRRMSPETDWPRDRPSLMVDCCELQSG